MATINPFDLLRDDDDDEDLSQLLAAQQPKIASKKPAAVAVAAVTKLEKQGTKGTTLLPHEAALAVVGGVRGGGINYNRENANGNAGGASHGYEAVSGRVGMEADEKERQPRPPYSGGRRGGHGGRGGSRNGDAGGDSERPLRRVYERRSGTGYGNEMKRDGSGRGNWGTTTDETSAQLSLRCRGNYKSSPFSYEKVKEEKRKALLAMKSEERKVEFDEELQSMKQLSVKKENDEVFIKLGIGKDIGKKKENVDREEKSKKPMSITEFFKPTNGGRYYTPRGRGCGRQRGGRGQQFGGNFDQGIFKPYSCSLH